MNFNVDGKEFSGDFTSDIPTGPGAAPWFVYDVDDGDANLPDVPVLLNRVIEILKFMSTDEMIELKANDEPEYIIVMENKFESFADRYYALFRKIISGEDLTPLMNMLAAIESVKDGKETIEDAEKRLGEDLAEQYIYPKIGGNPNGNKKNLNTKNPYNKKNKDKKKKKKKGNKKK